MPPNNQPKPGPKGKPSSGGGGGTHIVGPGYHRPCDGATNRIDQGVDFGSGNIYAIGDGVVLGTGSSVAGGWPGGGGVLYRITSGSHSGLAIYNFEYVSPRVQQGDKIHAGQVIATCTNSCEIGFYDVGASHPLNNTLARDPSKGAAYNTGALDGRDTVGGLMFARLCVELGITTFPNDAGEPDTPGPGSDGAGQSTGAGSGGGGSGSGSGTDPEAVAKAAAFATFIDLPGLLDQAESLSLQGERSLMNDQPLLPAVEQICQASLRNFQSMPNGNFFAFYPDYFGGLSHRTPYWQIHDIEILDGQIQLSDDALATHVYVVGDTMNFDGQVEIFEKMASAGVVTVFNAFMADFINGVNSPTLQKQSKDKKKQKKDQATYEKQIQQFPTLAEKNNAIAFLKKYGARPLYQEMPMIRSHFYELFYAYQTFCLFWSKQFLSTFQFTFMPELFPGGIVSFPDHGIQCYVDEVVHNCDYEGGFTTQANLVAPAAIKGKGGKAMDGRRHWVSQGLVRAGAIASTLGKPSGGKAGPGGSGASGGSK